MPTSRRAADNIKHNTTAVAVATAAITARTVVLIATKVILVERRAELCHISGLEVGARVDALACHQGFSPPRRSMIPCMISLRITSVIDDAARAQTHSTIAMPSQVRSATIAADLDQGAQFNHQAVQLALRVLLPGDDGLLPAHALLKQGHVGLDGCHASDNTHHL